MRMRDLVVPVGLVMCLAACGGATAPASSSASPSSPAATSAAKPPASVDAAASAKPPASGAGDKVNSAYSTISASSYKDWVGKAGGFFANHGLDVNLQFFAPATTTAGVVGGQIDIASSSPGNVATADAQGADLVMVAAGHDGPTQSIVANPGINSLADLKGEKVAATQRGATTDLMMRDLAREQGWSDTDLSIVYIPDSTAQVAALVSHAVDAIVVSEPSTAMAITQGGHPIYGPDNSAGSRFINMATIAMKRGYLASHRDIVKRYLMSYMDAIHFMRTTPDAAVPLVNQYLKLDDTKPLRGSIDAILKISNDDLSFKIQDLQTVLDFTATTAPEVAKLKPQDLIDTSVIDEIRASHYLESIQGK